MIESISIRGIGVISSAELEFGPGFTALTGETGAGKTMVLTALGLLLGQRADASFVRRGESQLFVEGRFQISDADLLARLSELGADCSEGELLVNRSVSSEGRSRAAISGASVPVSTLSEIADQIVAVHGQADQIRLRSATQQRQALDDFAGQELAAVMHAYQVLYSQYRELEARLERMQTSSAQDQMRLEQLRGFVSEIERANLDGAELEQIAEKIHRLTNVEALRDAAAQAHDRLLSEESDAAVSLLGSARRLLEQSGDPKLRELAELASQSAAIAAEVATELSSFLADLDADPAQLEQLNARKAQLTALERKHGMSIANLIEQLPKWQAEILDLDSSDEQIEKLDVQLAAMTSQLGQLAREISTIRKAAAQRLSDGVAAELATLSMPGSRLEVRVSYLNDFESTGMDRVEFFLSGNTGLDSRPLAKGASGGELSRIMLAIELVLAADQVLPTMIFDEVDAGVGGAAAVELGRRLKQLSKSTQVIVVTHLPQVAAFADRQIQVSKDMTGEITLSSITELDRSGRERELARMLSGSPDSEVAISHARELLNSSN